MTTPTDLVLISQSAFNGYAASVETEVATLNTEATAITTAVGVLGPYIASLVANQPVTYSDADVTAMTTALSDLTTSAATVTTAAGNVAALEPPAPTPAPTP